MNKRTICIITGSRAEWGLLYPLAAELSDNADQFDLKILATGSHLSAKFGMTYKEIEKDGFTIDRKVDIGLTDDTAEGTVRSVASGMTGLAEVLGELNPDMVFLLGDRFETFAAASACLFLKIPVAHIHGGELTEGALDDVMRHAITKMSYLHFVSTDEYKDRVVQLGEDPQRVFNVGALGIDNIKNTQVVTRPDFERKLGFQMGDKNIMVTYHPVTMEDKASSDASFKNLLKVLDGIEDAKIIFTKPNADMYSDGISREIDAYVSSNKGRALSVTSMGRVLYLSALKLMDVVAGNSSSAIIEVPSFGIPSINIGTRQEGRARAASVIDADGSYDSIDEAFKKSLSGDFREKCKNTGNIYGDGSTAKKIIEVLCKTDIKGIKKKFYDIDFNDK